jgi:type II secretory pathway component PulF
MPLYAYEALSKDGKRSKGVIDATSLQGARQQLTAQGLYLVKLELTREESAGVSIFKRLFAGKVKVKQKILFTKQLAILLRSGVPLLQAVDLLIEQFEGRLHTMLVTIRDELKEGTALATALQRYPSVFDNIYVQLVRAGEASGNLEVILERLTEFLERREAIAKRIKGAMQYPIIQLVIVGIVLVVMMVWVVPQISGQFASRGRELPGTTKALIAISDVFVHYWILLLIVIILLVLGFQAAARTDQGKLFLDKMKLRIPLIKYLTKTNAVVQFSYTLGMLLEGGVNLSEALDIVIKTVDNKVLAEALKVARDNIVKQGKIAQYLKQTGMFPPIAIYLIQTGEQTGELDKMLLTVARNYESDSQELIDRLTAALSPIMMIVIAVVVGFIVLSIAPIIVPG